MKRILTLLLTLMFCITSVISAYAVTPPDSAKVIFTIGNASGKIGENISVPITLKSTENINTIALSGFDFDNEALIFTGFSDYDEINSLAAITPTFDKDNKAVVVGLRNATKYDGNICKMNFTVKKAGTYTITANAIAKNNSTNIETFVIPSTVDIEKITLSITGLVALNKEYDGTSDAVVSGGVLNGKVSGDDVSVKFPTSGTFASADVENNIPVNLDNISITGTDKDNYTLLQPTGLKANITPRPITITARNYTIKKNNSVPTLEYDITSGSLVPGDELTGNLSVLANGTKTGVFDIEKGTLSAGSNYNLTFEKGKLTVVEKDVQNVIVDNIQSKIYGDSNFKLGVTDNNTALGELTYTSSNTDIATVTSDGTVTIKATGTTNITVSRAGNDDYADFSETKVLNVSKKDITITAKSYTIKQNNSLPVLEYDVTSGELVTGDTITGNLTVSADGSSLGEFDITQGTISVNNNYNLTFVKGKLTVTDKTPQNIVVDSFGEKIYGDAPFTISITPDATANLNSFAYSSSNTDVAEISSDGTITIKAAGITDITVNEPGNNDYAAFTSTQKLVVSKKPVNVTSVNLGEKTAILAGVLVTDILVEVDFDKLKLEITGPVDETTSNVTVTNFELKGEKSENYIVSTETLNSTIATDNTVNVIVNATNGIVTGAGTYLKNSNITLSATADSGYKFSGWYIDGSNVSTNAIYTLVADSDKVLEAKFTKISYGGGGSSSYTIKFETNGGNKIKNLSAKKNSLITEPTVPVKEGYDFAGWFTDKELTKEYDFVAKVTKSFTLYAKWTEADVSKKQIILTIGDKNAKVFGKNKSNDVAPKIVNERTMLPARFVAETLGAEVIWTESEPNKVLITKEDIKIVINIGSDKAYVNDKEVQLDSPAFIENDRTYTPIRFISEELGASVEWYEETNKVVITVK